MRFGDELRARLLENLARFKPNLIAEHELRAAAVGIVLLANEGGEACLVLTRRPGTLRRHAGQWALPGGRLEGSETVDEAALREIHEEIGLEFGLDAVLGRLDDFETRSGHLVSPIVVWGRREAKPVANPEEVDAVFTVPLDELEHVRLRPMLHFAMPSLPTTVHAPTAAFLYQFREVALHGREVRVADVEQPRFAWS